jgi:hypothetical protein
MGSHTDFAPLEDWFGAINEPHFEDLFAYVDHLRLVTGTAAQIVKVMNDELTHTLALTIMENWQHFQDADLGGWGNVSVSNASTWGDFRNPREARKIAKRIMRPMEHAADLLDASQLAVVKFRPAFYRYMAPMLNPRPGRPTRGFHP